MARPQYVAPEQALALFWDGLKVAEIARELRCSRPTVYKALRQARLMELRRQVPRSLTPTFPPGDFTPTTRCSHDVEPIEPGSDIYCPLCHRSGWDWHPYFRDVKPLPKDPKPPPEKSKTQTRREARRQRYAGREAATIRRIIAKSGNRGGADSRGGNRG